jgi:hypothetical protein
MKVFRILLFTTLLLLGAMQVHADVATRGQKAIHIELLNGKDFPGYKFYIKYQRYYYDRGYQPGTVDKVLLEPGKHYETGDRGSTSLLFAKAKKGEIASKVKVGGAEIDLESKANYLLDRIKITKIDSKGVQFVVVERQEIGDNGKVLRTLEKGSMGTQGWMIWMLPIVSLLGLAAFFLFRKPSAKA